MSSDLHNLTVAEASALIGRRAISPVEVTEAYLRRIEAVDGVIHSYITVLAERALDQARAAEREIVAGRRRGPLHGIPYGVKDNYHTRGIRTTAGSAVWLEHMPDDDATAHARMEAAGAILLGKLNTWEFGTGNGSVYFDLPFPPASNPWNPEHFTGGSSTGAGASVAAATAMCALGTDTGGSVRLPAAANALVGLKPTYGRVSRAGIQPNCWTLDCVGPLTLTVEDNAMLMQVIAGHDVRDPACPARPVPDFAAELGQGVKGLRIGLVRRFHERDVKSDPAVTEGIDRAAEIFRSLGAEVVEIDIPASVQDFRSCSRVINSTESFAIHEREFVENPMKLGIAVREKLMSGFVVGAGDYLRAQRVRRGLAGLIVEAMSKVDALLCCGPTRAAARLEDFNEVTPFTGDQAMSVFNLSGHPAIAVPSGFNAAGMPVSLQLAGHYWDEPRLLRIAAAYEAAAGWRGKRPEIDLSKSARAPKIPQVDMSRRVPDELAARVKAAGIKLSDEEMVRFAAVAESMAGSIAKLPRWLEKGTEPVLVIAVPFQG